MATAGKTEPKVQLPVWVLPIILTLMVLVIGNIVNSAQWAAQMTANQSNMISQFAELKDELKQVRQENVRLREEMAGLKAAQREGIGLRRTREMRDN